MTAESLPLQQTQLPPSSPLLLVSLPSTHIRTPDACAGPSTIHTPAPSQAPHPSTPAPSPAPGPQGDPPTGVGMCSQLKKKKKKEAKNPLTRVRVLLGSASPRELPRQCPWQLLPATTSSGPAGAHRIPRRGTQRRGWDAGSQKSRVLAAGGCRRRRNAGSGCLCLAHTHTRARAHTLAHTHTRGGSRELVTGAEQMQPGLLSLYQLLPEPC